jgi:predicted molibdopterin-dependent oxidoreductase YjgC
MCDEGRNGYKFIDDPSRLRQPQMGERRNLRASNWEEVIASLAKKMRTFAPEEVAILASAQLTNEELFLIKRIFLEELRINNLDFRVPIKGQPSADDFLIQADKNPNTKGAVEIGLLPSGAGTTEGILTAAAGGRVRAMFVFSSDLFNSSLDPKLVEEALSPLDMLVYQGSNANLTSEYAHFILPAATFAEKEGTFTNFQSLVQKINPAIEPLGESLPDWQILLRLAQALELPLSYPSPSAIFQALSSSVPAFSGLNYQQIDGQGSFINREKDSLVS